MRVDKKREPKQIKIENKVGHSSRVKSSPATDIFGGSEQRRREIQIEEKRLLRLTILFLLAHHHIHVLHLVPLVLWYRRGGIISTWYVARRGSPAKKLPCTRVTGNDGRSDDDAVEAKVGPGLDASEADSGLVVGQGGLFCSVEGAEPLTGLPPRVSDLGREPAPRALADAPEMSCHALPRRWKRRLCLSCRCSGDGKRVHGHWLKRT